MALKIPTEIAKAKLDEQGLEGNYPIQIARNLDA
jgi:hypothetical protein